MSHYIYNGMEEVLYKTHSARVYILPIITKQILQYFGGIYLPL